MSTVAAPSCLLCDLPLARGARDYCCSGCFLAHHLSGRSADGRADRLLARVGLSAFLAMGVMVCSLALYGEDLGAAAGADFSDDAAQALRGLYRLGALALSAPVMLLIGKPLLEATLHLRRWLSTDSLVLLATGAAWLLSAWNTLVGDGHVYFETATMILVLVGAGRWMESRSRERARAALERVIPDADFEYDVVGAERSTPSAELRVGDRVCLRPGETVPVDGTVTDGASLVDTAALTGEEQPRRFQVGDRLLAGSRLVDGTLTVEAEAVVGDRVRDEVGKLLEAAARNRSRAVRVGDRLAAVLLPLALGVAALTLALRWGPFGAERAIMDALSVLLISCPCALGIATPLAFWVGLGEAWRRGVLVRGGEVLERLAGVRRAVFDKTGTLTTGDLRLVDLDPRPGHDPDECLSVATSLEWGSEHPIGRGLRAVWRAARADEPPPVTGFRALPGLGVEGTLQDRRWRLVRATGTDASDPHTTVVLERGEEPAATLRFRSEVRREARSVVEGMRARGLDVRVLTGDGPGPARALAEELAVPVESELTPADKVERVTAQDPAHTLFVGDGLNDSAALAAAGVGASVSTGTASSLRAAPIHLLVDGLAPLPELVDLARRAVTTARVNLVWACSYNAVGLYLAATGRLTPVLAALAMVLSSAFVVGNSQRLAGGPRPTQPPPEGVPTSATVAYAHRPGA